MIPFSTHEKSKFWSPKNNISLENISIKSSKKYWFDCNTCDHSFYKKITHILTNSWCPYCSNQKLCEDENCETCFNKSFASHEKSIYWSNKNKENPREIFKSSGKKFILNCEKCLHEYIIRIADINFNNCSFCSEPPKKLCEDNDCINCFNKSFASDDKCKNWSIRNKLLPRQVFKYAQTKYFFKCNKNHEFESTLAHISNGRWCPYCKNKTELKLYEWLKLKYPEYLIKKEIIFNWCKNKRYDFLLEDIKTIIELDGPQHFKQISNWQSVEKTQINDNFKNKVALKNGYRMIRICQETVLYNKDNWEQQIIDCIENKKDINFIGDIYNCVF